MTGSVDHTRRSAWVDSVFNRALSVAVIEGDSRDAVHTKRLITGAMWFSMQFPWPIVGQLLSAGAPLAALAIAMSFVSSAVVLMVMWRRPSSFPVIFHVVIASNLAVAVSMTLMFGGFLASGINFLWSIALVIGAVVVFEARTARTWLLVAIVAFVASVAAATVIDPLYENPNADSGLR